MPRKSNERIRHEQAVEIARVNEESFKDRDKEGLPRNLRFLDGESLELIEQGGSGLKCGVGNIPVVRDVRPEADLRLQMEKRELQVRANAGHCGDPGDFFP
jgi:hypothetical protein